MKVILHLKLQNLWMMLSEDLLYMQCAKNGRYDNYLGSDIDDGLEWDS